MAIYRLHDGKVVIKNDNEIIVNEVGNQAWADYQTWLNAANTPDPAITPPTIIPLIKAEDIPALATATGEITDSRHGLKTNGVLHAIASTSVNGFMSSIDKTKLNGIAVAATTNSTDAFLLNRSNHTGSALINSITGLQTALDNKENTITTLPLNKGGTNLSTTPLNGQLLIGNGIGYSLSTLTQGSNITITNNAGAITISATGVGGGSTPVATNALTGTVKTDVTQTDPLVYTKTSIDSLLTGFVGTSDTRLTDARNPLAHNQAINTVTGLQTALDAKRDLTVKEDLADYKIATPTLLRIYPMFGEGTFIAGNTNNNILISGRAIYIPFVALKTGVINGITFAISTIGATTTSSFRAAIYSDNGSLYPGSLIATGTDLTGIAAAGVRTITTSFSTVKNALYWLGFNLANTAGTAAHTYRGGMYDNLLGVSAAFSPLIGYNTTGQSTTVLYTFPASVAASQPLLDGGFNTHPAFGYSYSS